MALQQLSTKIKNVIDEQESKNRPLCFNDFPVDKICDIECYFYLEIVKYTNEYIVRFGINASSVNVTWEDEFVLYIKLLDTRAETYTANSLTLENITEYINRILEIVPNLKINKLEKFGNVLTDSLIEQDDIIELFQFPNVELKYNPCSVCLDQCCTKTRDCKHPLCFLCCSKIKFVCNDMCDGCDNCCTRDCPICRGRFQMLN